MRYLKCIWYNTILFYWYCYWPIIQTIYQHYTVITTIFQSQPYQIISIDYSHSLKNQLYMTYRTCLLFHLMDVEVGCHEARCPPDLPLAAPLAKSTATCLTSATKVGSSHTKGRVDLQKHLSDRLGYLWK